MVIDSKVYDVTPFLLEHPGGDDILLDCSGRDATREFEDVGHSQEARAQLEDLVIGELREPTEEELASAAEENKKVKQTSSGYGDMMKWLFPILLVGVAILVRKYTR